ncbi:LacI family DNA-binding transcriptional regulator [Parablautia muri]|uniref:LacI family transcriptional regulator n=1 Tax=Parablautia muri TaxID=2320879 RepID=A0A9X5BH65_9FIRM|nr:LacI family DNA-binding transcriptional regulator [Parablautia muri]NBJ93979.1 LacI family transcriptional regulator [Parablautia muri]
MATIKDIAAKLGLSPSTVSIVLKGNGDKRKIKKETQQRILEAAKELGYKPNIQAKILRGSLSSKSNISLYWVSDNRIHLLSRFLKGLQTTIIENNYQFQLSIVPYENNHLEDVLTQESVLATNAIIICNPSETDMEYLENNDFNIPIVLYNRYSKKYSTVTMDDKTIGLLPAQIFAAHGKKHPALLKSPATFSGMNIRTNVFEFQVNEAGMEHPVSVTVDDTMKGGYLGALTLCGLNSLPDCLFCTSDSIALGALKAFYERGLHIPEQIELISVGSGRPEQEEYCVPSLSVISLPLEDMARECLKILSDSLSTFDYVPKSVAFPTPYIPRESCPALLRAKEERQI